MSQQPAHLDSRQILRGICVGAAVFSAFFAAHGVLMTAQMLDDDIAAGRIESIPGPVKAGLRIRLDYGREVVFPDHVLFLRPAPVKLAVGDRIEKQGGSVVYVVNGVALTDVRWVLGHWLLPWRVLIPLCVYLTLGTAYVLRYGRAPLADSTRPAADPKRPPRKPPSLALSFAMLPMGWLVVLVLTTLGFGCLAGCLANVGRAVLG